MQAYEIGDQTGLASLRLVERPAPRPRAGEVVVRPLAVCLGHRDLLIVSGAYGPRRDEHRVPASDGVGEIVEIGEGVAGFAVGDRVTCAHFASWLGGAFAQSAFGYDLGVTHDGWLAEAMVVPASALVKAPASLSDAQVAPLAASGLTAWNALIEFGELKAGDTVLTLGTGGVSLLALAIAKLNGARVAITSSSDDKLAKARDLGADIAINYATHPDWPAALMTATGGAGADIVVETGGFATLGQSIAAAAVNGRIAIIGALAGPPNATLPNFSTLIGKNLTLKGLAEGSRSMLVDLIKAAAVGGMAPAIDRVFPFEQAPEAYAHFKSGEPFGKVMIALT